MNKHSEEENPKELWFRARRDFHCHTLLKEYGRSTFFFHFFSKCSKIKENRKDWIEASANKRMIDKLSQAFGDKIFNYIASLLTDTKRALIVSISCVL